MFIIIFFTCGRPVVPAPLLKRLFSSCYYIFKFYSFFLALYYNFYLMKFSIFIFFQGIHSYLFKQFYDSSFKVLSEFQKLIHLSITICFFCVCICVCVNINFSNSSCNIIGSWWDELFFIVSSNILNIVLGDFLYYLNRFQWIIALFRFSL